MNDLTYVIDTDWRIVDASGIWVSDVPERSAADIRAAVIGTKLTDHIYGILPRMLICRLVCELHRHRTDATVPYRTDTSTLRRQGSMHVGPDGPNHMIFSHKTTDQTQTGAIVAIRTVRASKSRHCFNCNSLHTGTGWFDPFDIQGPMVYSAVQDVCPTCEAHFAPGLSRVAIDAQGSRIASVGRG